MNHSTECCAKNTLVPPQFGCDNLTFNNKKNKKKFKKKKWKNYSWKKRKYPYFKKNRFKRPFFKKRGRYYKNKNKIRSRNIGEEPVNTCPTKKKDCRCWYCNEDGHYANECPKKKTTSGKKLLRLIQETDLHFIQPYDQISDTDDDFYELQEESDSSISSSTNESEEDD